MQKTNQTNQLDGKETHRHSLEEEESLQWKAEEHIRNYFATLGNVGGFLPDTSDARSAISWHQIGLWLWWVQRGSAPRKLWKLIQGKAPAMTKYPHAVMGSPIIRATTDWSTGINTWWNKRRLNQETPPFQAQRWKILLTTCGSLSPASSQCSGLSSEPGHCLTFLDTAPLSFVEFEHLALTWYKFPRWRFWFPWQGPAERFWHCKPFLHCLNYQLYKGERGIPRPFIVRDTAALLPGLRL